MELPPRALVLIVVGSALLGGVLEWGVSRRGTSEQHISETEKSQNDVVTVVKEHTLPDGSSQRETTIIDKSHQETKKQIDIRVAEARDWMLTASRDNNERYMLGVQRRILGNIYLGVFGDTDRRYGVSLGLQF